MVSRLHKILTVRKIQIRLRFSNQWSKATTSAITSSMLWNSKFRAFFIFSLEIKSAECKELALYFDNFLLLLKKVDCIQSRRHAIEVIQDFASVVGFLTLRLSAILKTISLKVRFSETTEKRSPEIALFISSIMIFTTSVTPT